LEDSLVSAALDLLPAHPLRAADALHVATARRVRETTGAQNFCIASADKEVVSACASLRMAVLNPESPSALEQIRSMR
jgi:hypothetical protein